MNSQKAIVYYNGFPAGQLLRTRDGYTFTYDDKYFADKNMPSIALTFPKSKKVYKSEYLFPFFFGLLAEGEIRDLQCRILKIDRKDYFTRLIKTAGTDTIGAVTVKGEQ